MAKKPEHPQGKHYVSGPGREPTDDEALAMGYALFDRIAAQQAAKARANDEPRPNGDD